MKFGTFRGQKTYHMNTKGQQPAGGAPGNSGSHVLLSGSTRAMRPGAKVLGVADPDEWIEITIKVRRKKALPEPGGKVLSLTELEAQYGAAPADMKKVTAVLSGLGLKIFKEDALSCSVRAGGRASV